MAIDPFRLMGGRPPAGEPLLTEEERNSALWKKLKAHAEARIQILRARNDHDRDERATARLRGRIAEAQYFAALDKPAPQTEGEHVE